MRIVSIQYVSCESGHRDTKRQITKALAFFYYIATGRATIKVTNERQRTPYSFLQPQQHHQARPPFSRHGSEHHQDEPGGGCDEGKTSVVYYYVVSSSSWHLHQEMRRGEATTAKHLMMSLPCTQSPLLSFQHLMKINSKLHLRFPYLPFLQKPA